MRPLAAIQHVAPPGYLERFRAYHTLGGEESRALREMVAWLSMEQADLKGMLAETVLSRRTTQAFDALPTWDGALAGTGLVEELSRRFAAAGMEILYFDWSPPHAPGVHVVKAFVPGLEVETMSYHRIGARGVRKLMERGSALVGLGEPPPGAAPVRLTREQAAGIRWRALAGCGRGGPDRGRAVSACIGSRRCIARRSAWSGREPAICVQHERDGPSPAG